MPLCHNETHPAEEKKQDDDDDDIPTTRVTTDAQDNDVVAILLSRMTLLESLVQQQAIDLHFCRSEVLREREQQSLLREQVDALRTTNNTKEQQQPPMPQQWQTHFSTLQNQVLTVVTELNVLKEECAKEAKSRKELATAVQEHSADQLEQRQEITATLTEFKEWMWDTSGYYNEGKEHCRVLQHIQEKKTTLTTDQLDDAIRAVQQDWESRFLDLGARVDGDLDQRFKEQTQTTVHDLVERQCQSTADECYCRMEELDKRVEVLRCELNEAQEITSQQIVQVQESTQTAVRDALEKSSQQVEDRSAVLLNKSSVDCLEEALQDMAKEWDARIADVTTQLDAIHQKQIMMDKKMQKKIKQFEHYVSKFAAISNKTVARMEDQAKKSQEAEVARSAFEASSEQKLKNVQESLGNVEKIVSTLKETQSDDSAQLTVAVAGIQDEHRGILKGLDSKMDLFRGRVEYLASKIPNQEEDIQALKEDVPRQVESLESKYQSLLTRFEHLLNAVEQYNHEQSSRQEATQASVDKLRVQLEIEHANSERLFQESQEESRSLANKFQNDVIERGVDESCYPKLVIRPEVKQMLKQRGIINI